MVNLFGMIMVWLSASFCYYLISYQLKYIKGNLYINGLVSSSSEICAYALSGVLMKLLGVKYILILSYTLAISGMMCLIMINTQDQIWLSFFILGSKFGISSAFNVAYLGNQILFPMSIMAASYGICNVFSRIITIMSPYVAEVKPEAVS